MSWSFVRGRARAAAGARAAALLAVVLLPAGAAGSAASGPAAESDRRVFTAEGLEDLPALRPVMDCADMTGLDLGGVTDAPVTLTSAKVVTTGATAPYCEVRATVAPANTVVMRLPVDGWTQRYVQTGPVPAATTTTGSANASTPTATRPGAASSTAGWSAARPGPG
ncbi:hypothetical protein ACWD0J_23105 [Streptomyces sp. NPDC003011]